MHRLFPITTLQVVIMASTNAAVSHLLPLVLVLALGVTQLAHATPLKICPAGSVSVCSALTADIHVA